MFKVFALNVNFVLYFIFVDLDCCHKGPSHKEELTCIICLSKPLQSIWCLKKKRMGGKLGYRIQAYVLQAFLLSAELYLCVVCSLHSPM